MDISTVKIADNADIGAVLTVLHPATGVETDIKIRLSGTDSSIYRNWLIRSVNKKANTKKQKKVSFEEAEQSSTELLAALTLSWEGIEAGGKELKFTHEAAVDLYADPNMKWLREQVDEFVGERSNFFL